MIATLPVISVELPESFDERWSHLPDITIKGRMGIIDSAQYFFRFCSSSYLACDWDGVCEELLARRDGVHRDCTGADQPGFHPRPRVKHQRPG